jgi:hypothetical protein
VGTDEDNCGFCGTTCAPGGDRCTDAACHCGTGPLCDFIYVCSGGTCG